MPAWAGPIQPRASPLALYTNVLHRIPVHPLSIHFDAPQVTELNKRMHYGAAALRTQLPMQLYCRARPWFQIVVCDLETMSEIGCNNSLPYQIHRLAYGTKGLRPRSARLSFNGEEGGQIAASGADRFGEVWRNGGWRMG